MASAQELERGELPCGGAEEGGPGGSRPQQEPQPEAAALSTLKSREVAAGADARPKRPSMSKGWAIFQLVMLALNVIFLFGLPLWSWLFNDVLGLMYKSCRAPASVLTCGDGSNYTEIAVRLDRFVAFGEGDRTGEVGRYIGCGCSEGFFADWACAVDQERFSLSYFISSPSGTGAIAALSAWPILSSWLYQPQAYIEAEEGLSPNPTACKVAMYSQIAFQFFYGLFLINTLCVVPKVHGIVVVIFIVALIVHFATIGFAFGGFGTCRGRSVYGVVVVGTVAVLLGLLWPVSASWWGQHAFWLGEVTGLSCGFSIAPLLTYFDSRLPPQPPPELPSGLPPASSAESE